MSYKWAQSAGPAGAVFSRTTSATPTISNLIAGVYVFDLVVTDNDGAASSVGRTLVTVKKSANNKPPKASAGGYQTITLPKTSVKLSAVNSYDPDGKIVSYKWTQSAGPAGAAFSSTTSATPTVSKLIAGVYVFDLIVTDNDGTASSRGQTLVTVKKSANNKPPRASAGGYQTITLPKTSVKLSAVNSYDPDGKIVSYKWTQSAGPAGAAFSNSASSTPIVSKLKAGVYVFDLVVTDNAGAASSTGRTQVTVFQPTLSAMRTSNPSIAKLANMRDHHAEKDSLFGKNMVTTAVSVPGKLKVDAEQTGFRIYPNPVHHVLRISFNKAFSGKTALRVISMNGQVVKTFHADASSGKVSETVNVEGLGAGVYLIQLLEDGEIRGSEKMIKY
jgi:hypothetical protein